MKNDKLKGCDTDDHLQKHRDEFEAVCGIISAHRKRVLSTVIYETCSSASFSELIEHTGMSDYGNIVPFETAQRGDDVFVPIELAQIPRVLFATGWTNHQIIKSHYWHHSLQGC